MKLGSLFSGGGLGDFGFMAAGFDIRWQVEIDPYCQKVLALRYPESKKYRDIKSVGGLSEPVKTEGFKCGEYQQLDSVDIITGGFPCQPFSVAGKQKGKEDNRYLWPEMFRVIKECRPRWIVGENVPGIINLALDTVCADLEAEGYEVWPIIFPSHALGAWHKRDRLWLICHAKHFGRFTAKKHGSVDQKNDNSKTRKKQASELERSGEQYEVMGNAGLLGQKINEEQTKGIEQSGENVSDTKSAECSRSRDTWSRWERLTDGCHAWRKYWATEPAVGRVANGIADRVHRLKMLGNGQVPACTYVIGRFINEIEQTINQGE